MVGNEVVLTFMKREDEVVGDMISISTNEEDSKFVGESGPAMILII